MLKILILVLVLWTPFVAGLFRGNSQHTGNASHHSLDLQNAGAEHALMVNSLVGSSRSVQRRVYIDLGANWANTLRLYRDLEPRADVSAGPWEVYAFEASPFIQPYLEQFTTWLNGVGPKPAVTVPPSGSTKHLALYAHRYGCPTSPDEQMRQCMWEVFREPLQALKPDPSLGDWELIKSRLAMAAQPLVANSHDRYVSVPAAAGAKTGTLNLGLMTAEQMIRGGANSSERNVGPQMTVPLVDFANWFSANFRQEDYVIVKMDIEGAEFSILNKLLDAGHGCLFDILAWECHDWMGIGNCHALHRRINQLGCVTQMTEGQGYRPWDSESTPEKYYALDPRASFVGSRSIF